MTAAYGDYCIYLRRSRADIEEERRGQGETLARHYHMLMELAQRMGIVIPENAVYREIVSGDTVAERPQMQRLLRDVENRRWRGVFVADVDRLARGDTMDQGLVAQTFLYSHTLIISPYKTYDPSDPSDREFFEMKLFFARREYDQIKRRLQAGRVNSVKEGLYVGSIDIYGYKRVKLDGRKGWSLEVIPEQADVVRMIFDWYIHGINGADAGGSVIAMRLNDMGIQTARGGSWEESRIINMIKNPTYCGYVWWRRRVQQVQMENGVKTKKRIMAEPIKVRGLHEPIIDEQTFEAAQQARASRRKSPNTANRQCSFIFAGLVKCSICGHAMIRGMNKANPARDVVKCSTPRCLTSGSYIIDLENAVLEFLQGWVDQFDNEQIETQKAPEPADTNEPLIANARKQIETLKKQISRLRDLLEQGIYTPEVYLERQAELNKRIEENERTIQELTKLKPISMEDAIRREIPQIKDFLAMYQYAETPGEKNVLLRSVIGKIIYTKTEKRKKGQKLSSTLSITVYPVVTEN